MEVIRSPTGRIAFEASALAEPDFDLEGEQFTRRLIPATGRGDRSLELDLLSEGIRSASFWIRGYRRWGPTAEYSYFVLVSTVQTPL